MAKKKAPGTLNKLSTDALQRELARRSGEIGDLQRERAQIVERINWIDSHLASLGKKVGVAPAKAPAANRAAGTVARRGGGARAKNSVTLVDALAAVLKGKKLSVSEAAVAVQKAGYKTTAANFRVMVNLAFIKNKKIFKRISHGVYTA